MNENLFEIFRRSFPADLGRTFLERPDGSALSYADLLDLSGRVAQVLAGPGREARRPRRGPGREERRGADALPRLPARRGGLPAAEHRLHGGRDPLLPGRRRAGPVRLPARSSRRRWRSWPASSACRTSQTLGEQGDGSLMGQGRRPPCAGARRRAARPRTTSPPSSTPPAPPAAPRAPCSATATSPRTPRPCATPGASPPTTGCCTRCRSSTPTACSSPPTSR